MLYFLNLDGTMTLAEPQRVFQGSNNVNTVYVLSAIAPPTALEISFTLPSGLTTAYYPMIYNGTTDEYTVPNTTTTVYLRSFLLTSNITAEVGTVGVSVNAVYSNADGTTGNQTSFTGSFNVEYSSIPESVTTGAADELQQALDLLSQYYTQQQAIITGGTNGEYLQSQGNNQLPVWTSFDMDFVTANRAQSFSNAQKAQARTNIGAASQTEMSAAADNINTLNTTVDALEQVALTANQKALVVNEYNKQLNLFKNKKLLTTYAGVTLTPIGLSSYKITGTNTESAQWGFNDLADVSSLDPNKTYTLKLTVVSGTGECGIQGSTTVKQVSATGASLSNIQIIIPGSQAFSDYVVAMMLVEGSTAADYIPYYGDIIHQAEIDNSVVKYSSAQSLTDTQKAQARTNIGAEGSADSQYTVKVVEQTFTEEQKTQARMNINAACATYGAIGNGATATTGGAVGSGATATTGGAIGIAATADSGGAIGSVAKATYGGGAVGRGATTAYGGAVGHSATAGEGGAVGHSATAGEGGAVGSSAKAGRGFSGGYNAQVGKDSDGNYIDAIQLGTGTNNTPKTLQVYDHKVYDSTKDSLYCRLLNDKTPAVIETVWSGKLTNDGSTTITVSTYSQYDYFILYGNVGGRFCNIIANINGTYGFTKKSETSSAIMAYSFGYTDGSFGWGDSGYYESGNFTFVDRSGTSYYNLYKIEGVKICKA